MSLESVFTLEATPVKFGPGASLEVGWELRRLGLGRVLLFTDPEIARLGIAQKILDLIKQENIEAISYDRVRIEPSLYSLEEAIQFAHQSKVEGFVALGGGSTIDTAKVANLVCTNGGEIMDYVNPPIGKGQKPGILRPLVAIPTTSGSGSEATTVAVLDLLELKTKTGISHRLMRPTLALVDPELTRTTPASVTAATGLDVVCHAAESYLSKPYNTRTRPSTPDQRPPYQGSNPIADIWSGKALEFGGKYLRRAVASRDDLEAKGYMMLSATMAGIGFGSAGVHIPHACAYPIAGLKHTYRAEGYPSDFVPHGFSVTVTAPAAFRFTYPADPERHLQVAELLTGQRITKPSPESLPQAVVDLMRAVGAPSGLAELGYVEADIPQLVEGALKQQRLLAIAPKMPSAEDLKEILHMSMRNW